MVIGIEGLLGESVASSKPFPEQLGALTLHDSLSLRIQAEAALLLDEGSLRGAAWLFQQQHLEVNQSEPDRVVRGVGLTTSKLIVYCMV